MERFPAPDARIAELAGVQFGVVSRRQLRELDLRDGAIEARLRNGRLHRLHHGVYAVGHAAVGRHGRWLAAVLACGPGAALSHHAACAAWEMRPPRGGPIDVTVPTRSGRSKRNALRIHRVSGLTADETDDLGPLRVTSVGRTLLDLAPLLDVHRLEQAIHHADQRGRFDLRQVRAVLAAHPGRAGQPKLAALLDRLDGVGARMTRSALEVRFLRLCADHELPLPAVNTRIDGFEVDFRWPGTDLVIETDGAHHRMPEQRERDHAKRLALEASGHRVVALTYRQVTRDPAGVAAALRKLLANRPGRETG